MPESVGVRHAERYNPNAMGCNERQLPGLSDDGMDKHVLPLDSLPSAKFLPRLFGF